MAGYYGQPLGRVSVGGSGQVVLPNGACGYQNLSVGACGCRRFWLKAGNAAHQGDENWQCFCGHHACFHDNVMLPLELQGQNTTSAIDGRRNVFPSPPAASAPLPPGGFVAPTWSELIGEHAAPGADDRSDAADGHSHAGLGIQTSDSQAASINTRLWEALNGFARHQQDGGTSRNTSQLPSTAAPSLYGQPRAETPTQYRGMGPPVYIPANAPIANRTDEYSATEVATPSLRGTPDLRPAAAVPAQYSSPHQPPQPSLPGARTSPPHQQPRPHSLAQPTPPPTSNGPALSIQEMCNTIQHLGQRISTLESVSFSYMPSDTLLDKFDLLDGRVLDMEHWRKEQDKEQMADDTDERLKRMTERVDDLEQWRMEHDRAPSSQQSDAQEESSNSRHHRSGLPIDTSSFASDGSFDEDAAAQTETVVLATLAASAESAPRIDALESRIVQLEAALPSWNRPWSVQVVLLPFSRHLPGVWFSADESSRHYSLRSQASEGWNGPQAASKSSFTSETSSGWTTESIEAWNRGVDQEEWLSPKACGPSGTVFQRLASRGLVRDVVLQAPDSHHIWNAISQALGSTLHDVESSRLPNKGLQGLQERLIPLRKVRKSTRLRFLSPAEMVTSASWDARFLESVCMRVSEGERRLYLTTPEGYTQPGKSVYSWPSLRNLPAYGFDGEAQAAQIVGKAIEACWTHNHRLDHPSSLHSSFQSEESPWEISSEDGGHEDGSELETAMLSPTTTRHSHVRSLSFPSSTIGNGLYIECAPKRRAASFEVEPSSTTLEYSAEYVAKRRRVSTSPELERRGVNFTPRWSREPPSPYTVDDSGIGRSSQAASSRHRATTPFAYATPHSHFESRGGEDNDTEIDALDVRVRDRFPTEEPEEWEGVQDDHDDAESLFQSKTQEEDGAVDEGYHRENQDNSMTVYDI